MKLIAGSRVLLVGEGNLSFALSLATEQMASSVDMIATTFEDLQEWSEEAEANAARLNAEGMSVIDGIDATKLERFFPPGHFDRVIFLFPNTGSRVGKRGRTSDFVLIRAFLRSARPILVPDGLIVICAVNNPYYEGRFQFADAAADAGYRIKGPLHFDPKDFPGYQHTNTKNEESAIEDYRKFGLWIFRPV